ncbi:MAG: 3-oxoacyl-[acyl-carrier-protein] reductase [Deltaproteobacteria bacterium]|nr:3-oxoacyl-[acyl-carrier-protein] reductase [Deltaproteobacteria bacterium]
MDNFLSGQVAVVTGGARGIGRAICKQLAQCGAQVVINYSHSSGEASILAQEITSEGGKARVLQFDVADPDAVENGFREILDSCQKVDILVNNAGIAIDSLIVRSKVDDWKRVLDVNLSGCFYCCRAVSKAMMKARYGRIVNISSVVGEMGNAGQAAYAASKAGIIGLTKSLARELAGRGVTVNAIAPGYIETDMTRSLSENIRTEILEGIPLNRLGTPEDVAAVVGFFCGNGAGYITGEVLGVNGGMYM